MTSVNKRSSGKPAPTTTSNTEESTASLSVILSQAMTAEFPWKDKVEPFFAFLISTLV